MSGERLLLHLCCGPCTAGSLPRLLGEGYRVEGFFHNPNIHPVSELRRRMEALRSWAAQAKLPVTWSADYGLVAFIRAVANREKERCEYCYLQRLRETAREARRGGYEMFSTTLLHSIFQRHDLLRDIGEQVAREEKVPFLYLDLREEWKTGRRAWRDTGLYSQTYCGCMLSEMERHLGRREPSMAGGRP